MKRAIVFVLLLVAPLSAVAQPLVEWVPGDAFVYVGWKGGDALGPEYEQSRLKKFIESSTLPQMFRETLPQLQQKMAADRPEDAEQFRKVADLGVMIAKHPAAFFVSGFADAEKPAPTVGLIVRAGADAAAITAAFKQIAASAIDEEWPVRVIEQGDIVALVGGLAPGASLQQAKVERVEQLESAAFVMRMDAERLLPLIDKNVKHNLPPEGYEQFRRGIDASGIAGLKRFEMSGQFVGGQWMTRSSLLAPVPRKGVVKLLEPQPLDAALLARVPADSAGVTTGQFDFAALIGEIRNIVGAVDPQALRQLNQAIGAIGMSIGRRLDTELFASLGTQWAMYSSPSVGGEGQKSLVLVNKLRDEKLAKATWADVHFALGDLLRRNLPPSMKVTTRTDDKLIAGTTVYSFVIEAQGLSPCFAIKDGFMYVAMDEAILKKAVAVAGEQSLTARPEFVELHKALGGQPFSGFSFADLPTSAPHLLQEMETQWPQLVDLAAAEEIKLPARILPTKEQLLPLLSPALSIHWVDEQGMHSRSRSPFPGSELFGYAQFDQTSTIGASAVGVSILLPSLNRARDAANRVHSASNLRQIGMASILYGNENKMAAAPDLGTLLTTQDLTIDVFTAPASNTSIPADIRKAAPQKQAAWVNEHSDYVYIVPPNGQLNAVDADTVLAYEKFGVNGRDGVNMLFGDGHVEFQRDRQARELIQKQTGAAPVEYKKRQRPTTQPQ